jgi:uncharacterized protein YydD (DUF2326 family)
MRTLRIGAPLIVALAFLGACSSGGGGSNQTAFCDTLKKADADKSLEDSSTPTKEQAAKIQKIFNDLSDNAPSAISADVNTIKDAYPKILSNDAAFLKDKQNQQKVQTALKNLEKYSKDKCKVDLSGG